MIQSFRVGSIVMEASTKDDQKYMNTMSKHDVHQINGQAVQNLYELTIKRSNIDFGDIPDSKGDIEKCKYFESTTQCLDVIKELLVKNNIADDTVDVVKKAISNMLQFRPQFTMGFKMKHDFVMLTYNSLVMAIVDTTTMLIRSYTDYIVTAEPEYKLNTNADKKKGWVSLNSLRSFNQSCENGQMAQSLRYMLDSYKKALVGADDILITGAIVAILLSIVPVIRELIYFYYSSRVKMSDYLALQADFLEMNTLAVKASTRSPQERKEIVKKQEKLIKDMRRMSDKIMIDHVDTDDVVKKQVKDESSIFSLTNIDKQISKNKMDGNDIMIL